MAGYGGGGGPPGLGSSGDGSIQAILARLQQTNPDLRTAQSDNNHQQSQYAPQQLQQQFQPQQWQPQQPHQPGADMRNVSHTYLDNHQQQQQPLQWNNTQQSDYHAAQDPASYHPPAAPTPPSGSMFTQSLSGKDNSLLSLLKPNTGRDDQQSSSQPTVPSQQSSDLLRRESMIRHASDQGSRVIHAPAPASADPSGVLAALMKGKFQEDPPRPEFQHAQVQEIQQPHQQAVLGASWNSAAPPDATEQYLLNLLNKPKPSQHDDPVEAPANEPIQQHVPVPAVPTASSFEFAPKESNPPHLTFESSPAPVDASRNGSPATHAGMFTHKDPFRELHDVVNSPSNRGSASRASGSPSTGHPSAPIHILKKSDDHKRLSSTSSHLEGREPVRRKYDSTPTSQGQHSNPPYPVRESEDSVKESVSEAVSNIAAKVDIEAQEAIDRAEDEQAQARITQELEEMMAAETNHEFESKASIVASDIKHELEKKQNSSALDVLGSENARAVRDILDDAAQGPVVDSWESAEADDEIVVIEDTSNPITVWNFPMKPWISITVLTDGANDTRPVFHEDIVLDIARLKKDFDQMDRNLVASSEYTLAYGMSKAGGLRVIRQDDGRDAKLFSDTKDRIFNVAISSTPADENTTAKEALIGTGISGTVYWAQTKDGEKDHIEDAHIEQYGFALSPSSAQEGEAPGGVLKTRARPSSNHPEFFAVGRGKSINIIFPAFVMQRNLLKPNHDRVVDTDRLARECSLKINTGKAGKDFSFSHDDTMVVSLDKSGRVKFWDVRELTATDATRMPVHTSFEVKDPLMTLTTTPEGEKAWPTSVLLLDKLRPYQKRTALRYMIVGMKQNHTLQLWDLALGKPVQEFNLPHSKESDAVCSVMYHPPSGIIVVGHPTRNSIYFLHLSAPKYALKSSSQVDYVQKLVSQDPNLPNPDSTAVISGMREYSFANKGVLRSLYLLQQPASGEESTLFELYAMHSKGVACIPIKASDLGWDKDNKVIQPMDAIEARVVETGKLKQPPPPAPIQPVEEAPAPAPIRLAVRTKEPVTETPLEQPTSRKQREDFVPPKQKDFKDKDLKDEELLPSTTEKPEKKGRKKKAASEKAAAAAVALADGQVMTNHMNGTHPRVVNTTSRKSPEPAKPSPSLMLEVDTRINALEKRVIETITDQVTSLHTTLGLDAADRDAKFSKHQGTLLSMVSTCLTENCQEVLANIVENEMVHKVVPKVGQTLEQALSASLESKLGGHVSQSLQKILSKELRKEVQAALPSSMEQALRKPELIKAMTEKMVGTLANKVEDQLYTILEDKILPRFTKVATDAAMSCGKEVLANVATQFRSMEELRTLENQRMDQLMVMNASMSETLNKMATAQATFQTEIIQLRTEILQQRQSARQPPTPQLLNAGGFMRSGNGAFHSPANSQSNSLQSQPLHHVSAAQSQFAASQYNPSVAGVSSPQVQQWPSNTGALVVSPPVQDNQYPTSSSFSAVNPSLSALQSALQQPQQFQQLQQFAGPPSQASSQTTIHQLAREQAIVHPTPQAIQLRPDLDAICQRIRNHMIAGNFDTAVMTWIQEAKQDEEAVFAETLAKYDSKFIHNLNPLLLLTVAATVSNNLEFTQVLAIRLAWIEALLQEFAEVLPKIEGHGHVRDVAPKVLALIKSRLQSVLMKLSATRPNDPSLATVPRLLECARAVGEMMSTHTPY